MMHICLLFFYLSNFSRATIVTYAVPPTIPIGSAALAPAPVGVSFEFAAFPSYFTAVAAATHQCLHNFANLTGTWPPMRIGGSSQDRAAFNASSTAYIVPSVPSPTGVAASLEFGPSFMTLASTYKGTVVLGLNRALGNLSNTIAAAISAKRRMRNLLAIELGNEPDLYLQEHQPIATAVGSWSPTIDAESEDDWDIRVGRAMSTRHIIQAGNFAYAPSIWGAAELIKAENATVKSYVKSYSHHNYPGGELSNLMSHVNIVKNVARHYTAREAATAVGKDYVLGETNSVAGGGTKAVSPTFGAALWTMDYSLRASCANITRSYFHQGNLGPCYYCWWSLLDIRTPYYGAYTATAAMAGGSYVTALDLGTSSYAVYIIYDTSLKPLHALLYNSEYYSGGRTREIGTFVLTGLMANEVRAKRLTAPSALSTRDNGETPSFGGQHFQDGTCIIAGTETFEYTTVANGQARFNVAASEALLIYLQ